MKKLPLLLLAAAVLLIAMSVVAVWQAPPLFPAKSPTSTTTTRALLDVNAASAEQLTAVPGIDSDLAAAIVAKRDRIGRYENLYQLQDVDGMSQKKWQDLLEYLTVSS